jgi:hypothetical protein
MPGVRYDPGAIAAVFGRAAAEMATALRAGGRFLLRVFGAHARRAGRPPAVPFRRDFDVAAVLAGAGLEVTTSVTEVLTFRVVDARAWWEWAWSQGMRDLFETLTPTELEGLRRKMFAELSARTTPSGIPMVQHAAFVVAEKHPG